MSDESYPKVSIIVTSRSNKEQLTRCLEHVYTQNYQGRIETVVVDNASSDNSIFVISRRYPQVKLVRNDSNLGIGAALNAGLKECTGKYVVTLHQDVELNPDFVQQLVRPFETDPKVGVACGLVLFRVGQGNKMTVDSAGIGFRQGRPDRYGSGHDPDDVRFSEAKRVTGAPGCAAMYRKSMLDQMETLGEIFDEDFFAYYEDHDISLRAAFVGYSAMYVPGARALHKRGILRMHHPEEEKRKEELEAANLQLLMRKCLPFEVWDRNKKILRKHFRNDLKYLTKQYGVRSAMQAYLHLFRNKGKMAKKTNVIFESVHVSDKSLEWEVFGKR